MRTFVFQMFGSGGKISSKRVVTISAFIVMSIGFFASVFGQFHVDKDLFQSLEYIVMSGLVATASEKFTKKHTKEDVKEENEV